ncbi:kinesin-like protein KIF20B [Spea bombifrons]|uniref:kinesin-like protein KIF20B n=1 Tax=Spea bombifrons TaxID=233779 RepID=UPI00234B9F19|nr:kinesin-like protein KIF20B [Spea bombifrons]
MESTEDHMLPRRPSYLGVGINLPEMSEPQSVDDIRTNLADKFLLLEGSDAEPNQKNSSDSNENMHVYLRVRPFTLSEIEQREAQECVSIPDFKSVLVRAPQSSQAGRLSDKGLCPMAQKFTFTQVFGPETTQPQFFEGTIKQQVIDFMKGHNRLIFTYGVTNAGKTFTFQGTKDDAGILPRSMEMLFNTIQGNVYSKMDVKPHRCRDYIRLTKDQVKVEVAFKNNVLRQIKEVDPQCSIRSNSSRTSADTTDFLNDEVVGGFVNSRVIEFEDRLPQCEEFRLDADSTAKYSVWVSFCEIYNECIYDLLDPISGDKFYKRKTLRLAQDIKGFCFVKDLQWIQVSDAKEACRILALGKKFQSIAFTKLNSSSSRSHSIFTVRLLKIEDADIPRVVKVSEMALCDLAGSERCTKTQNEGERLKESGNINTSLLILGKCINALKNSQQSKIQQHVPFRESKLTHYLQSFFTGKGKVSMIVNICQSASSYDETLNVLKFSAVAQKVLILDSCQTSESLTYGQKKSAREVSFIINNADRKIWTSRKRATVQWDSRLEDVLEDGDDSELEDNSEDEECLDCTNLDDLDDEEEANDDQEDDIIIKKDAYQKLLDLVEDLKTKLVNEKKDKLLMELRIREEVAKEFTQHFMERENDFSERLEKEKELMEERCDERLEIFQDLVRKCTEKQDVEEPNPTKCSEAEPAIEVGETSLPLQGLFSSMQTDLAVIKKQAVEAHLQIAAIPDVPDITAGLEERLKEVSSDLFKTQEELKKTSAELEKQIEKYRKTSIHLEEADKKLSAQKLQIDQMMQMMQQKESAIDKLKELVSHWEHKYEDYEKTMKEMRGGMEKVGSHVTVLPIGRKRPPEDHHKEQPPSKKEVNERTSTNISQTSDLKAREETDAIKELEDIKAEKEQLKRQIVVLNQTITRLEDTIARNNETLEETESKNKIISSELQTYKELLTNQEGTVKSLLQEVDQNKENISIKVAQIRTIQNKLELFKDCEIKEQSTEEFCNFNDWMKKPMNIRKEIHSEVDNNDHPAPKVGSGRESAFYSAVEGLWKKCHEVLQELAKKNQFIEQLEENINTLKDEVTLLKQENESLQLTQASSFEKDGLLKEKDNFISQLQGKLSEKSNQLEIQSKQELDSQNEILELKKQLDENKQKIKDQECTLDSYNEKCNKLEILEKQIKEKAAVIQALEKQLEKAQTEKSGYEKELNKLNHEKTELEQITTDVKEKLKAVENTNGKKQTQLDDLSKQIELLKKDLSGRAMEAKTLQTDLQRKDEDYADLKDKLADAKKQIQQVEKEVSAMREEKKLLSNKVNEYEKLKNQLSCELEMKQRTIQQLKKECLNNEGNEDATNLYRKTCQDVQAKEKIIEDMRMTLIEQEQTQAEQDQALEAKTEEAEKLAEELEIWKLKYKELEKNSHRELITKLSVESSETEKVDSQVSKLQAQLNQSEEKYSTERKKWLEEKMNLLAQAKESETHRNKEMRKFAEDRERHVKQQGELEQLCAQLAEKENTLLKWREERDQLVSALEVQLKSLLSSNMEKEREIENLKKCSTLKTEGENVDELKKQLCLCEKKIKELEEKLANLENSKATHTAESPDDQQLKEQPTEIADPPQRPSPFQTDTSRSKPSDSGRVSTDDCQSQDGSGTVLDSSEISTENGRVSRFPKPEMEIRFSPARPNKMEVKHCGEDSPRTVKITRTTRKRKSHEMEQDIVKSENKRNIISRTGVRTPSSQSSPTVNQNEAKRNTRNTITKQQSTSSTSSVQKKDGTLQKLGGFLQSSPSIFQSKAKKLLETISAPKTSDLVGSKKENDVKPKKSKRKLYNTDISAPLDFIAPTSIVDKNEKESDHLIMKRRLRTRTAK